MEGSPIPSSCDVAVDGHAQLGEGPRWDAAGGRLLWVDILGRKVHRYDPSRGRDDWVQLEQPVSAALPHDHGGPILALPDGLYETDWETLARIVALEEDLPTNRSNDAACDPAGRLWAGTMALDERTASAGLYRVGTDLKVQKAVDGTTVSNGLGWSPERDRFYFIDSPTMRIDVFDYDVRSGEIENRRQFATVQVDQGCRAGRLGGGRGRLSLGGAARRLGPAAILARRSAHGTRPTCPCPVSRAAASPAATWTSSTSRRGGRG